MTLNKREERIPARMPMEVYERIATAAKTTGASLNQFLVQAALEKANNILERELIISLSKKGAEEMFELMENPPAPNERLKEAMRRREEILCSR